MTYTPAQMRDYAKILLTEPVSSSDIMEAAMLRQGAAAVESLAAKDAELARLTDSESANGHERSLIDADTQRGITDCSTPHELVKQDAEIARLQARWAALKVWADKLRPVSVANPKESPALWQYQQGLVSACDRFKVEMARLERE
jgi:hypothetical protein